MTLGILGGCAWRCCRARFLLLFGRFGTAPQSSWSAMGWLVWQTLCFLRASVGDVRHFGGCAWRCCRARFLLLFGRFGTAPQSSWSAMGWLVWQNLCFLRASVGDVRHFGGCAWRCCRARFLLLFGRFGAAPQSSWSAMGWLVWQNLCFLRASVGDVRHFWRCAWRCCRARFLLLFGRFGTAPQSSWSAMGWLVWQNLCFLRASVGDVKHFGGCAWRCCRARFLLVFGRFGTAPQKREMFVVQSSYELHV